jgi:hypothetical protein
LQHPLSFCADVLFSVGVVGSLVVFVWRGLWVVMDDVLLPGTPTSYFASLGIGYAIFLLCFVLQSPAAQTSARLPLIPRIIFEDVFVFGANFGAVNVWRGGWLLLNHYFVPRLVFYGVSMDSLRYR